MFDTEVRRSAVESPYGRERTAAPRATIAFGHGGVHREADERGHRHAPLAGASLERFVLLLVKRDLGPNHACMITDWPLMM